MDYIKDLICPLCGLKGTTFSAIPNHDLYRVGCQRCGDYEVSGPDLEGNFELGEDAQRASAIIREIKEKRGNPPRITFAQIREFVAGRVPGSVPELGVQLLRRLASSSKHLGDQVEIDGNMYFPVGYCRNPDELHYLLEYLKSRGWITMEIEMGRRYTIQISPQGWSALDESLKKENSSDTVFVAMWFDPKMDTVFSNAIEPAITRSGYKSIRVDREEFSGKIDDKIVADIRGSKFIVADFTGHRNAVYFEAGFALGLGLPVIWLCHDPAMRESSFDTRQYNHIAWQSEEDLRRRLETRILALFGPGPLRLEDHDLSRDVTIED